MAAKLEIVAGEKPATTLPVIMDATITSHRSLTQTGFALVMLTVATVSFGTSLVFLSMGAWPVIAFFGLDAVLVWYAFKLNYQAGRREKECVRVCPERVLITRHDGKKAPVHWSVSPHFARVSVEYAETNEAMVFVQAGGVSLSVAALLSPPERSSFAAALRSAISEAKGYRWPSPNDR